MNNIKEFKAQVREEVLRLWKRGESQRQIARKVGYSQTTVFDIIRKHQSKQYKN